MVFWHHRVSTRVGGWNMEGEMGCSGGRVTKRLEEIHRTATYLVFSQVSSVFGEAVSA